MTKIQEEQDNEKDISTHNVGVQIPCSLGPKNRRKVICGKLKRDVGQTLRKLCEHKKIDVFEGIACEDHIHICVSIPLKYSVSTIVGYLKGKSTMILFERYSHLRRNFHGHTFWARCYYVSTVGLDEAEIRQYTKTNRTTIPLGIVMIRIW